MPPFAKWAAITIVGILLVIMIVASAAGSIIG